MEFESFEHALQGCMDAAEDSDEQKEAMIFCLEHAPADLRSMLEKRLNIIEKFQQNHKSDVVD